MNGEVFYESFKDALRYVGLSWGDKHLAVVSIVNTTMHVTYGNRTAVLEL